MSTTLVEVARFPPTITVPVDGDTGLAATVDAAFQALADRTKLFKDGFAGATKRQALNLLYVTNNDLQAGAGGMATGGDFRWDVGARKIRQYYEHATILPMAVFELTELPDQFTLAQVHVVLEGDTAAALPTLMPSFRVQKIDGLTGLTSLLGTVTDGSASAGAFEVPHVVSLTALTEVVNEVDRDRYYVEVIGKNATATSGDLYILGMTVSLTAPV